MWGWFGGLAQSNGEGSTILPFVLAPTWVALIVPVTLAALTVVGRAFTAEARVRKKYNDDVWTVKDRAQAACLPIVASVVVKVHNSGVAWPKEGLTGRLGRGQPGDPETDVSRRLVGTAYAGSLAELARLFGLAGAADRVSAQVVSSSHRQGWAMGIFLVPWLYLSFWVSQTGLDLPRSLAVIAFGVGTFLLGWFLSELLSSVRESNAFYALVDEAAKLRVAEDSA